MKKTPKTAIDRTTTKSNKKEWKEKCVGYSKNPTQTKHMKTDLSHRVTPRHSEKVK